MSLRRLIWKEIYVTLRNPQIIIGILLVPILFIAMGSLVSAGIYEAEKAVLKSKVYVLDRDGTWLTKDLLRELMKSLPGRVVQVAIEEELNSSKYDLLLIVPRGFTNELLSTSRGYIVAYVNLEGLSIAATGKLSIINELRSIITEIVKSLIAARENVSISILKINVSFDTKVFVGNLTLKPQDVNMLSSMIFGISFIIAMMLGISFQFSALSMAQEKEEKTFEVILAQLVSRTHIGIAKMVGVIVLTLIEISVFTASWLYYMRSIIPVSTSQGAHTSIVLLKNLGVTGVLTLLVDVFIIMMCASIIGLIIGGISRDTRSAGMIVGPIMFILIMAALSTQWLGVPQGIPQILTASSTLVMTPSIITYLAVIGGKSLITLPLMINIIEFIILICILKKFMESEVIVTGWGVLRRVKKDLRKHP